MESIEATVNPYDAVRYPGYARPEAHPGRFGAVATWCGMQPAPMHHCRVLEIGCGDGAQILPMADMFPGSHFMGIDLAPGTIAVAREIAERAGLKNVTFEAMDLMEAGSSLGEFDYIIAHGFLSWVPQPVRDKLLSLCRELLAPQGCVYISYNTLPGCHWRLMLREMLLFHTMGIKDPVQKVGQARALVEFLSSAQPEGSAYKALLQELSDSSDAAIYHDDMADVNEPVYFYNFCAQAARQGLQYVADSTWLDWRDRGFPDYVVARLTELGQRDFVLKNQYLDFLRNRRFRRSILCRTDIELDRSIRPGVLLSLFVTSTAKVSALADGSKQFQNTEGETLTLTHPVLNALMLFLIEIAPASILLGDAVAEAANRSGADVEDMDLFTQMILYAASSDFMNFQIYSYRYARKAGEHPLAPALARVYAQRSAIVTNLRHNGVDLRNTLPRHILPLADGTRDRTAIRDQLAARFRQAGAIAIRNDQQVGDGEFAAMMLDRELEGALEKLVEYGLLLE